MKSARCLLKVLGCPNIFPEAAALSKSKLLELRMVAFHTDIDGHRSILQASPEREWDRGGLKSRYAKSLKDYIEHVLNQVNLMVRTRIIILPNHFLFDVLHISVHGATPAFRDD